MTARTPSTCRRASTGSSIPAGCPRRSSRCRLAPGGRCGSRPTRPATVARPRWNPRATTRAAEAMAVRTVDALHRWSDGGRAADRHRRELVRARAARARRAAGARPARARRGAVVPRRAAAGVASAAVASARVALHPTCSLRQLDLEDALRELAQALADEVVTPAGASCCGMAGDRGLRHPALAAAALADETARSGRRRPLRRPPVRQPHVRDRAGAGDRCRLCLPDRAARRADALITRRREPVSSTSATACGSSVIGTWPQSRSVSAWARSPGTARGGTSRSNSHQATVTGTVISVAAGEVRAAHLAVDGRVAAGARVVADEPRRLLVGQPLRVGDDRRERRPADRRDAQREAQERPQRAGHRPRVDAPTRAQRAAPEAGRGDRGDTAGAARPRELERHPRAERVAGDVRTLHAERVERRRKPRRRAPPASGRHRRAGTAELPNPGRSIAMTSRCAAITSTTGSQARSDPPSACSSTSVGPAPRRSWCRLGSAVMDLTAATCLITGANRGIGDAIARELATRPRTRILVGTRDPAGYEPFAAATRRCRRGPCGEGRPVEPRCRPGVVGRRRRRAD